jgi:uncharacterized membrane protein YgcG
MRRRRNNMKKTALLLTVIYMLIFSPAAHADVYSGISRQAVNSGVEKSLAERLETQVRASAYKTENIETINGMLSSGSRLYSAQIAEKVLEGIAKNAPEDAVVKAALKVRSRYEAAAGIAEQTGVSLKAKNRVAVMTAEALAAGASPESLAGVASQVASKKQERDEYAETSIELYRDMVRYGVEDSRAKETVEESLRQYSSREIAELRSEFGKHAAYSNTNELAESMCAGVRAGREPGDASGHGGSDSESHSGGMGGSSSGGSSGGHGGGDHGGGHGRN